jgi:beta-glucanase (GH16 family)
MTKFRRYIQISLLALFSSSLVAQVDNAKWYVFNDYYILAGNDWCSNATQAVESLGYLTMTAAYGSNVCDGHTTNYNDAGMISRAFSFTYGTVKVRAKVPGSGVHSGVIWMEGGLSGASAYPPVCVANIIAKAGQNFGICTTSVQNNYEVDIGEVQPAAGFGVNGNGNYLHVWSNGVNTSTSGSQINAGVDLTAAFHVYELDWSPTQLIFKLDGVTTTTLTYSLGVPMFLIMDQEIDSTAPPQTSGFYPLTTQYDYVRVCSSPTATCDPGDSTMIFEDEFNGGQIVTGAVPSGAVAY